MSVLSDRIRQERQYVGYSVAELAGKLGIPAGEFEAFETGEAEPTDNQLTNIACLCGTTPDRLRGEDLRADPRIEQMIKAESLTHADVYELHRFAEFLRCAPRDEASQAEREGR